MDITSLQNAKSIIDKVALIVIEEINLIWVSFGSSNIS